jgi:hypothetical protein
MFSTIVMVFSFRKKKQVELLLLLENLFEQNNLENKVLFLCFFSFFY